MKHDMHTKDMDKQHKQEHGKPHGKDMPMKPSKMPMKKGR